eukprot:Platyproteum_vivax@DN6933_c0_g1_i2.p1
MNIYGIVVTLIENDKVILLSTGYDTSSLGFFEKGASKETCNFLARTILPRVQFGKRQCIDHDNHVAFCMRWSDGLGILMLSDKEYPDRVAFTCVQEVYREFLQQFPLEWQNATADNQIDFTKQIKEKIVKYKNPETVDKLTAVQSKVDQTQEIMRDNVQKLLKNGEDLEGLVAKSEDLSDKSKMFYKSSKKLKFKCC